MKSRWVIPFAFVFSVLLIGSAVGLVAYFLNDATTREQRRHDSCLVQRHLYDGLHAVIVESFKPQSPSPDLLLLFPQIAPLYTPGTPQYENELIRSNEQRDRVLSKLGKRPAC